MQKPHNPLEGERPEMVFPLNSGSEEKISIIVIHKDRPEYLSICLQTIAVTSINNNYEIIVVDNASGQETQEFLDTLEKDVKIIRNDKNLYWSASCNQGAAAADKNSRYLIFLHCDSNITNAGWIDLLINVSLGHECGMVGTELSTYYLDGQKVDFIHENCLLLTRDCWKDCGPWPEELPMVGHSFIMTVRAQQKEYKPQAIKSPICCHYKIFSVDVSEYEKMTENACVIIPKMLRTVQSTAIKPIF